MTIKIFVTVKNYCYKTLAHETFVTERKDNNFHIIFYFHNSILEITNINSEFCSSGTKIQKTFLWANKQAKIKYGTLCNNYSKGSLKNGDMKHKILALRCSWIKRL